MHPSALLAYLIHTLADDDPLQPAELTSCLRYLEATSRKALDDDDGEDAARMELERKWARRIAAVLGSQLRNAIPRDLTPDNAYLARGRLQVAGDDLRPVLLGMLLEGARLG